MSDTSDFTHARLVSQQENENKSNIEQRKQLALVTILEWIANVLTSPMMTTIMKRLGLLAEGGWLPGMGDIHTLAAFTNRPVGSLERIVGKGARQKQHVGRQAFYDLSDFAQTGEDPAE
jgi:hypothetical protein